MDNQTDPLYVVPVIAEELVIARQAVAAGSVRIRKEIRTVEETIELPAVRDVISIEYIPIERPISEIPPMREEGDTLIIPVVAEELIVQKQLVLKQEIHLRRARTTETISRSVTLDHEHVVIERLDAEGTQMERSEIPGKPEKAEDP